jgi:hypothetical protein
MTISNPAGSITTGFSYTADLFIAGAGSATAPSYTFAGDTNTGIYSPDADQIGFTTGGTVRLTLSTTALTSTLVINGPVGTAAAPALTGTDVDSGIYFGTNLVHVSTSGVLRASYSTTLLTLAASYGLTLTDGDVTLSEGKLTITDTANEIGFRLISSATTQPAAYITANSLTNGEGFIFESNSASANARPLVYVLNDNTAATGTVCLQLKQDAANAFMNLVGTAAANTTDPISTLTTPGAVQGFAQVDINGTKRWIAIYADPS